MRITCVLPDASYSLAKMLYTLRTAPRPVWKFLFIASYICFCLSGETVVDCSLACRSILFDVRKLCWSDELTSACGIDPETLPAVLPTGACAGTLTQEAASALGLPQSVKVVIGSHDQIVNALGCGVANPAKPSIRPARSNASARCSHPSPKRWTLNAKITPASRIWTGGAM